MRNKFTKWAILLVLLCHTWWMVKVEAALPFGLFTREKEEEPTVKNENPLPWQETLGSVIVRSESPLEELGELRENLTLLQNDLLKYLGIPEPQEPIYLCLFAKKETYVAYIRAHYPPAPLDRPALYVKANGPGVLLVQQDDNMLLNVRHEMTHAILNASLRNVPIWIDEGLAKYFETPQGSRGYENPFLVEVRKNVSGFFGRAPSLERLEKLQQINQMGEKEYRESWAWVHFMIHYSPETHKLLAAYLLSLTPEKQKGLSQQEVVKIQKTAPLASKLKEYLPEYRDHFIEHYKQWKNHSK